MGLTDLRLAFPRREDRPGAWPLEELTRSERPPRCDDFAAFANPPRSLTERRLDARLEDDDSAPALRRLEEAVETLLDEDAVAFWRNDALAPLPAERDEREPVLASRPVGLLREREAERLDDGIAILCRQLDSKQAFTSMNDLG